MIALGRKEGRKAKVRIIGRNSEGLCLIYNERRNVKGKTKEPGLKISKRGRSGDSRNGGKRKKGKKENSK